MFTQCSRCRRHVLLIESFCPFCSHLFSVALGAVPLVVGCKGNVDSIAAAPDAAAASSAASASASSTTAEELAALDSGSRLSGLGLSGAYGPPPSEAGVAPQVNVTIAAVTRQEGDVSSAERTLAGVKPRIRGCYARAVRDDPDSKGSLQLSWSVNASGKVESLTAKPTGKVGDALLACVRSLLETTVFEPPEGGKKARLKTEVIFEGKAP